MNRDSVFFSSFRIFCTSLAAVLGALVGIFILIMFAASVSKGSYIPTQATPTLAPDANGSRTLLETSAPVILRIDIDGVIGEGDLTHEKIEEILFTSQEDDLTKGRVKGVLLYINTPGGAVTDADDMYRALLNYKKKYKVPIYSYVDGLCASGGMYIASATDKIYASSSSVIGSIGVLLGPAFNFSGAMDKIGVQSLSITQGLDKDMLNPFRPWKEGEDKSLRAITAKLYEQFVDIVTNARPKLDKEKLVNVYGAQVYVGPDAETYGYVDNGNSDYATALKELTIAADILEKQAYQVVKLEIPKSVLSELIKGKFPLADGKITHTFQFGTLSSELSGKWLYLYQPTQ